MKKIIYSAWPYANGELHLGRIGGSLLPADIFYRYCKDLKQEKDVYFISGTDMHGTPIIEYAKKVNKTYYLAAKQWHDTFIKTLNNLDIFLDIYSSTHNKLHEQHVNETIKTLHSLGVIVKQDGIIFFCESCNKIITERFIIGNCSICKTKVSRDYCNYCNIFLDDLEILNPKCKICYSNLHSKYNTINSKNLDINNKNLNSSNINISLKNLDLNINNINIKDLNNIHLNTKIIPLDILTLDFNNKDINLEYKKLNLNNSLNNKDINLEYPSIESFFLKILKKQTYKLNLEFYKDEILKYCKKILSQNNFKQIENFYNCKSLKRDIIRDIDWGIKSPFGEGVVYVWFEALCSYLSHTSILNFKNYHSYYFMGIDNLIFHSVLLPTIHMALKKPLPTKLFIRKYFLKENTKMSSSEKNYYTFDDLQKLINSKYCSDYIRFYFCSIDTLRKESNISLKEFEIQINNVFINLINNFFIRFLKLSDNLNFQYTFSENNFGEFENRILEKVFKIKIENNKNNFENNKNNFENNFLKDYCQHMEDSDLVKSFQTLISHFKNLNAYFQNEKCWETKNFKTMNHIFSVMLILSSCLEIIMPKIIKDWNITFQQFIKTENSENLKEKVLLYLKHIAL